MTKENKELLLKDLCARLPYDVKVRRYVYTTPVDSIQSVELLVLGWLEELYAEEAEFKPYLFPLSSISEEQKKYISDRWGVNEDFDFEIDPNWGEYIVDLCDAVDFINWCYENHFDINGLIPKGSALDATDKNIY